MKDFNFSTKYCTLVINHCDVGKSCRAVGEEMGVGRTQIMNILKRKRDILDDFENKTLGDKLSFM
jgi:predicted DNA-binding protein YlxM (UPF0122 family)